MEVKANSLTTGTKSTALDLSVVIIALNEESNLPRLLKSLPKNIELILVDSNSTDKTVELAKSYGARVEQRDFDNYSAQKNFALNLATRAWVLSVDADEELSPKLAELVTSVVAAPFRDNSPKAYFIRRKLVFMGRVLHFGKTADSPTRLIRRGAGKFVSEIHERLVLESGNPAYLAGGVLYHFSYANLTDYFRRFNDYTSRIAQNHFKQGKSAPTLLLHVLRPFWEFVSRYFLRLGFLDGHPGFCYTLFSSVYTFVKYEKLRELIARGRQS